MKTKKATVPLIILLVATGTWIYLNLGSAELLRGLVTGLFFSNIVVLFVSEFDEMMKKIGLN